VRVLFASTRGAGHFGPLIPFLDACLRTGHEPLVVGPPGLDARGYPFHAGEAPPDTAVGRLWAPIPTLPPAQADVVVVGTLFASLNVEAMLPTLEQTIEEWKPDLVVRETYEYASAIAAERLGIRHVRIAAGTALNEEAALAFAGRALDEREPGITRRVAESAFLTCFPSAVDPEPFPVSRFRHPITEIPAQPLPDWWPGDDRPLVYMSFGTVAAGFPLAEQAYPAAVVASAELRSRVLLSTGGNELELGELPPNLHVEPWVSEPDVLAAASVAVGHGGAGTTLNALAAGCPLVVVPLFGDQPYHAVRVAVAGAGVPSSIHQIAERVEHVLANDRYRTAVRALADEMRAYPPVDDFFARY
jgi:hypothetical protein